MKIKTDMQLEIEVPEIFAKKFSKAKENDLSEKKDVDFWDQDETACFHDWFFDEVNVYEEYYNKLCPEDIATFLIQLETHTIAFEGGYPIENWFSFKDNGFEYNICAFGWTSSCTEAKGGLNMIGYKEKV